MTAAIHAITIRALDASKQARGMIQEYAVHSKGFAELLELCLALAGIKCERRTRGAI